MKEQPILFTSAMVNAILEGRKNQTRRLITDRNTDGNYKASELLLNEAWVDKGPSPAGNAGPYLKAPLNCKEIVRRREAWAPDDCHDSVVERLYPKVQAGDRFWVKEAFQASPDYVGKEQWNWLHQVPKGLRSADLFIHVHYRADQSQYMVDTSHDDSCSLSRIGEFDYEEWDEKYRRETEGFKWIPSIYMPRWASRITLLVKSVRIERLQEISIDDIEGEGVYQIFDTQDCQHDAHLNLGLFVDLWDSINGKTEGCRWDDNPWVLVYDFEVFE